MTPDSAARADVEKVMNPLLELAGDLLQKYGEFYPFAGFLDSEGAFHLTATYDGNEHPSSTLVIADLRRVFEHTASQEHYRAIGLAYDVRVTPPGSSGKVDAVLVELEHHSGYRVNVCWPYTPIPQGRPAFGAAFAVAGTLRGYHSVSTKDR